MNYFGMIFSFTLPGVIVGILIALAVVQAEKERRRRTQSKPNKRKLYVEDMRK